MNAWDLACIVRFQAFPFIEDHLKKRPIRQLLELDVGNTKFQEQIKPLLESNQFTQLCKTIALLHHRRWIYVPLPRNTDLETIETLFWEESDEILAKRILETLLHFPTHRRPILWTSGTNMLLRTKTTEDKECALFMLEAFAQSG